MSSDDELTELTIAAAAGLIAAGKLSPVELTDAHLARIGRLDSHLNAFITVTAEQARAAAAARADELAAGTNRGPLHGIPIALKDNIDTAGVRTTAGSAVYADRVPTEDAPVVTRLRDAGAVTLGKLNMHEFAYGGTSVVSAAGPVRNPWNVAYSPGGSSGGSGAAVAARLCAAALGTDTAASVRFPAACCGVTGLKATHGLASIRGIVPLSESHDHVGPISRSVEDCAIVMDTLVGYDPLDPTSITAELPPLTAAVGTAVHGLRLGVPRHPFYEDLDGDIATAVDDALAVVGTLTASVVEVELPPVDSWPVLAAEVYAYHAALVADPLLRARYDPITLERVESGAATPAAAVVESRRAMTIARNTINEHLASAGVDVLVTPTAKVLPAGIDQSLTGPPDEGEMIRNTLPFNVYGLPAISVPCGFGRDGLPIGLHLAGPRLGEAAVIALAHAYQQATDWHTRVPEVG